jgi:hypothetical protein
MDCVGDTIHLLFIRPVILKSGADEIAAIKIEHQTRDVILLCCKLANNGLHLEEVNGKEEASLTGLDQRLKLCDLFPAFLAFENSRHKGNNAAYRTFKLRLYNISPELTGIYAVVMLFALIAKHFV